MDNTSERTYSIRELAETADVSRRTVRFYVQRGLIDPPQGRGRGSVYTSRHLEQIRRVRAFQRRGFELDVIRTMPEEQPSPVVPPSRPFSVLRIPLARGVRLEVDATQRVPSPTLIDELVYVCTGVLQGFYADDVAAPRRSREEPTERPQPPDPNTTMEGDLA